jgi:uncharacterized protein YkwD
MYNPGGMRHHGVLFCVGALVCVATTVGEPSAAQARTVRERPAAEASAVIGAVNALRSSHGLPPYSVSSILMGTAQAQADYMASTGSISHTGPGGSTVTQRLLAAGYPLAGDLSLGGFRSENVVGSPGMTAAEAVNSWTGDAVHLHTMLSTDLQEIGAGVSQSGGVSYYVIDCARPTTSGNPQDYSPGAEAEYSSGLNEIIVPVSISTPNAKGEVIHEVQSGQSLWQIAISYGVKINDIRSLNQLATAYVINPGDTLLIKTVDTPTPEPPTAISVATEAPPTAGPVAATNTAEATVTATPTPAVAAADATKAGTAVGAIILVALVAAGLVAWAGRARPV